MQHDFSKSTQLRKWQLQYNKIVIDVLGGREEGMIV